MALAAVSRLTKTDLCTGEAVASLERRLRAMNAAARIHRTERAVLPLEHLLHIHAFDLAAKLAQDADFLVEELPFEWGGLYRLPAGIGELVLQPGPDPTMDLVAFAGVPGTAGPDTPHEARIEALRRFSQPPVTPQPGRSLPPGPHRYARSPLVTRGDRAGVWFSFHRSSHRHCPRWLGSWSMTKPAALMGGPIQPMQ